MTARRYAALLVGAFALPGVVLYGGLFVVGHFPWLSERFGNGLFRAMRNDAHRVQMRGAR